MAQVRITPSQMDWLIRLYRRAWASAVEGRGPSAWQTDVGGKECWRHLERKGMVAIHIYYGSRGGQHWLLEITDQGIERVTREIRRRQGNWIRKATPGPNITIR